MSTSVTLAGRTLPNPSQYTDPLSLRVVRHIGLDGMVSIDKRAGVTTTFRDVSIGWEDLTIEEVKDVIDAYTEMVEGGSAVFYDPLGVVRTASPVPGSKGLTSLAYAGKKNVVYEALFKVNFQMRVTP